MHIFRKSSRNAFNQPENFDIVQELKQDRISVWAGGNDWEPGITAVCARSKSTYRGEQEQVWFQLLCPKDISYDDMSNMRLTKEQDKILNAHGEKAWKKWISVTKEITKENDYSGVRLKYFEEALKHPDMKPYVDTAGWDITHWKQYKGIGRA